MREKIIKILLVSLFISTNLYSQTCQDNLIKHEYFSLCFNIDKKLSRWVKYTLDEDMFSGTAVRKNNFKVDPLIKEHSPKPSHYKGSGHDRGHLAPAGDMHITQKAMDQSFYMTNISAQVPSFNRGIWKRLENLMRSLVAPYRRYTVITGPLFDFKPKTHKTRHLNIPKAFYKIIFFKNSYQTKALAFLIPNEKSRAKLTDFLVPINTIEILTGIDFFSELPDHIENELESTIKPELWRL